MQDPADTSGVPQLEWREHVAIGLLAEDLTPDGIARHARIGVDEATRSLTAARAAGMLSVHGSAAPIGDRDAALLVADLQPERAAEIHASVARHALVGAPEDLRRGIEHLRRGAVAMRSAEIVTLADSAGRVALDVHDDEAARELFELALQYDSGDDRRLEAQRNFELSRALIALDDPVGSRAHLMRAALLAEAEGDTALAVRAACRYALPADWQSGDTRAAGLLERVLHMDLSLDERTRIHATQAQTSARVPVATVDGQQLSWVSRPSIAQPLAEQALADSERCTPRTRLLALLAWRHTHRAPEHLERRRAVSTEAVDLARTIGALSEQVEAAVLLAVDALEGADRAEHRRALAIAARAADEHGGPRMRWRALVPAAAAAMLEGDDARADAILDDAMTAGQRGSVPGLLASEWLLAGHAAVIRGGEAAAHAALAVLAGDTQPLESSTIGRPVLALLLARTGRTGAAATHALATLDQLEDESSLLLSLSRLADVALELRHAELAERVIRLLTPWSGRIALDSNGWWCDGPVDLWIAACHVARGDRDAARAMLDAARTTATATADQRAAEHIERLATLLRPDEQWEVAARSGLNDRELAVLVGLADGLTYSEIAERLTSSTSTVRNHAVNIYQRLGVRGRSEAAVRAVELGIVKHPDR